MDMISNSNPNTTYRWAFVSRETEYKALAWYKTKKAAQKAATLLYDWGDNTKIQKSHCFGIVRWN